MLQYLHIVWPDISFMLVQAACMRHLWLQVKLTIVIFSSSLFLISFQYAPYFDPILTQLEGISENKHEYSRD